MKYAGIAFAVIAIAASVVGAAYMYRQEQTQNETGQMAISVPSPIPTPSEELMRWTDQSEFTFEYAKSLTVNPHEEDTANYAHVELTHLQHPGHIIFWTKDTTAQSLDDWIKREKLTAAIDTFLGGQPAKKTLGEKENTQVISVIRNGYLYQVEADLTDRTYWEPQLSRLIASYAFAEATGTSQQQSAPATNTAETSAESIEEEIIE